MGKILRRTFLVGLGAIGGGLLIGGYLASRPWENPLLAEGRLEEGEVAITPFVSVSDAGAITVYVPRAEMGQGVQTTLAAMVAEELGVDLADVAVEHGPASGAYFNAAMLREGGPFSFFNERLVARATRGAAGAASHLLGLQVTGGSSSTRDAFDRMRRAGAAAREALRAAAAAKLSVGVFDLKQEGAAFLHEPSGVRVTFADVASDAAGMTLDEDAPTVPQGDWRLLGRSQPRVDMLAKATGAPIFGIDVDRPDMLHATVVMSPVFGGRALSAKTDATMKEPGVVKVVPIEALSGSGFAIIARDTWSAFRAVAALEPEWSKPAYPADTDAIEARIEDALENGKGAALLDDGNTDAASIGVDPARLVEASYAAPHLAHMAMEPMNATAQFVDGRLTVWTGTQAPTIVKAKCAEALGIEPTEVEVETTHLGGGFGRRGEIDFPVYAALVARETEGRPVKVTWSREEDTTHDTYRPAARARYRAVLGREKGLSVLDARIAVPSVMESVIARTYPSLPAGGPDRLMTEGAFDQPYEISNAQVEGIKAPHALPVGFWRSVGNSHNAFFHESFMDECAAAAGTDPLEFRLALAEPFLPAAEALRAVAEMSGWGTNEPDRAKGLAFCLSFGAWVAQVVEVEERDSEIALTRAWCAADLGTVLDPDIVTAQMRGGMIFGLSAAIGQAITVEDGRVVETNYDTHDALRIGQAPPIEVRLLENHSRMGGAGEPGVPPAAPALANALTALTGKRPRAMPFDREFEFVGW